MKIQVELDTPTTLHMLAVMAVEKLNNASIGCLLSSMAKIANSDEKMYHRSVVSMAALASSYLPDSEWMAKSEHGDIEPEFHKAREHWKEARLEHQIEEATKFKG